MVAVLPRGHPLARASRVALADLLDAPLVLMDRDSSVRRIVDAACAPIGRMAEPPPTRRHTWPRRSAWCARAWVRRCCRRPRWRSRAASDLVVHAIDDPRLTRQLGILRKRQRAFSPAAEAFVADLEAFFARRSGRATPKRRVKSKQ